MGNIMYVVAIVSGVFIALNIQNIFISGLPFTIAVAVPFLNMTRQFSTQINQISGQIFNRCYKVELMCLRCLGV